MDPRRGRCGRGRDKGQSPIEEEAEHPIRSLPDHRRIPRRPSMLNAFLPVEARREALGCAAPARRARQRIAFGHDAPFGW